MTKLNYTPAPWIIGLNLRMPYLIYGGNDYAVADCKVYHGKSDIEADMRLIAAAPEMYEALKELNSYVHSFGESHLTDMANKALKKAEGE